MGLARARVTSPPREDTLCIFAGWADEILQPMGMVWAKIGLLHKITVLKETCKSDKLKWRGSSVQNRQPAKMFGHQSSRVLELRRLEG